MHINYTAYNLCIITCNYLYYKSIKLKNCYFAKKNFTYKKRDTT